MFNFNRSTRRPQIATVTNVSWCPTGDAPTNINWNSAPTMGLCPVCGVWIDSHGRCNCNSNAPEAAVSLTWAIAEDVDAAFSLGKEDATEGRKRDTTLYTSMNQAYNAYNVGFNEGIRLCMELGETFSPAVLNECAWFDEICGAGPLAPVVSLSDADVEALFSGDYSNVEVDEYRYDFVGA